MRGEAVKPPGLTPALSRGYNSYQKDYRNRANDYDKLHGSAVTLVRLHGLRSFFNMYPALQGPPIARGFTLRNDTSFGERESLCS